MISLLLMRRSKQRDLIDSKLREYAACGVAFHHAGLDILDRRAVEQMFIDGGLKLIVSTSVRPDEVVRMLTTDPCCRC
jgi:replicative superfamily II helicase